MSNSLADWLQLREPVDAASRSIEVTTAVLARLPREGPVRAVDLAAGRGANIRFLSPRMPPRTKWAAVDRDASLLADAPSGVERVCRELGQLGSPDLFDGCHLVTASALLDLVSERWIAALADRCRRAGAAVLFALNYNGRSTCTPEEVEDGEVLALFNRHQRSNDKGFGQAAGPDAGQIAARVFTSLGYEVLVAASDWILDQRHAALQRELILGWAAASSEMAPERASAIGDWRERRIAHVNAGASRIVVGHDDVGGWI